MADVMKSTSIVDQLADIMNEQIEDIVTTKLKTLARFEGATITGVNQDGTYNLKLDSSSSTSWTGIKNQTSFVISNNERVIVAICKNSNGTDKNAWICAVNNPVAAEGTTVVNNYTTVTPTGDGITGITLNGSSVPVVNKIANIEIDVLYGGSSTDVI